MKGFLISLSWYDFEGSSALVVSVLKIEVQKKSGESAEMCTFMSDIILSVSLSTYIISTEMSPKSFIYPSIH